MSSRTNWLIKLNSLRKDILVNFLKKKKEKKRKNCDWKFTKSIKRENKVVSTDQEYQTNSFVIYKILTKMNII